MVNAVAGANRCLQSHASGVVSSSPREELRNFLETSATPHTVRLLDQDC